MNAIPPVGAALPLKAGISEKTFVSAEGTRIPAIRNLSFEIKPGGFVTLFGPSGCGKTTTLRILLGLEKEYTGSISVPHSETKRIAAVFQEPTLLPWRTVDQNIRLAQPKVMKDVNLDNLYEVLGLTGMGSLYPSELSLGLARRVALARAFALEPSVMLLDEPFASLDEKTADRLRELLVTLWSARPTTALMVTHNLREALKLSDRIIVLSPRPARVVGIFEVSTPRRKRIGRVLDKLQAQFARKFPIDAGEVQ